jgi:phosphinothricin acetyltransferase
VALSPYSSREAYAGVGEVSVYVRSGVAGRGIGTQLLGAVVASSEEHGMWTLFSGVFPENGASIRIHLKNGFRILCQRMKVARLDGVWRDTLLLERRSERIV